jgi:hypothetical protein
MITMQVDNCDRLSKPRLVKPNLSTEEPVCPDGQLQCGNGKRSFDVELIDLNIKEHVCPVSQLQCGNG